MRTLQFDSIDSTNAEAHRLAGRGERGPLWIVAKRQTGGRGRLGRSWISELGNLYCTYLFSARCDVARASQLGFVASLAVFDMAVDVLDLAPTSPSMGEVGRAKRGREGAGPRVRSMRPGPLPSRLRLADPGSSPGQALPDKGGGKSKVGLKWPNDVLLGGAKFCGILPEVLAQPSREELVIGLGIGINLAHAPEGMPYPVTALGNDITIENAFAALSRAFETWRARWNDGANFAAIRDAWQDRAVGIGASVTAAGESGIFRGLAQDGALILELESGEWKHVHSGEARISHPETSA